jgi:hypothetical protein
LSHLGNTAKIFGGCGLATLLLAFRWSRKILATPRQGVPLQSHRDDGSQTKRRKRIWPLILVLLILLGILVLVLSWGWSGAPEPFDVVARAKAGAKAEGQTKVVGYVTTNTLIEVATILLDKSGGYVSNDITPPGLFLDNITNWEYGVLTQIRDLSLVMRNDFTRSQTQSTEDTDLTIAQPKFNYDSDSWAFPASENEYREGIVALERYRARLAMRTDTDAQFYARADNLANWLQLVEKKLGSLSQRLTASVGQERLDTDLAGDSEASQAKTVSRNVFVKTPWLEIDDVFYEARGATWAMIHFLKAAEHDFGDILRKKAALVSLQQIIRELEATQETVWSPMILNGSGFGLVANHSLSMASYISRANAAIIDLRTLLEQG